MLNLDATLSFGEAQTVLGVADGSAAAELYLDSVFGSSVSNVSYTGSDDAGFLVKDFVIAGAGIDYQSGILLSSGAYPGDFNSSPDFSVANGQPGDADLDAVATAAFAEAGTTNDAAVIEFDLFVDDPTIEGIRFDIVFGSEEYPEFSNSSYVDVAAVWIDDNNDGVYSIDENRALFNGDPTTPLSVIDQNIALNFIDNQGFFDDGEGPIEGPFDPDFGDGEFIPENPNNDGEVFPGEEPNVGSPAPFPIEWNGFGGLSLRPQLQQGMNSIKIAIGDTGDDVLDSGIYLTNFEFLSGGATGDDIFKVINGAPGANDLDASEATEEIRLADESGSVTGTLEELDGDVVTGFTEQSELIIEGQSFGADQVEVVLGSAVLNIDADDDGAVDSVVTLEGDFEDATFLYTVTEFTTVITYTISVGNNPAVIGGDTTGAIQEDVDVGPASIGGSDAFAIIATDTAISTSGTLTVTDTDPGEASFTPMFVVGTYGNMYIQNDGNWKYLVENNLPSIQALAGGTTVTDTLTVDTVDGTTQDITITIAGTNDDAVIGGDVSGDVVEDTPTDGTPLVASGSLTIDDVDTGENSFTAATVSGVYGDLVIDGNGDWSYQADNDQTEIQELAEGATLTDTFTVSSVDGTTQDVTITITGANDGAVIGGDVTGSVTEDDAETLTTGGVLTVSDTDAGEAAFVAGDIAGTFGTLTVADDGTWSYSADNSQEAIQALDAGQTATDTFTVASIDGTEATIDITINGTDEVVDPVIDAPASIVLSGVPTPGAVVGDLDGTDVDAFSIVSGNDSGALAIDGATGEISVVDVRALFESGPDLALTVAATNATGAEDTADITLSLPGFDKTVVSNSYFKFGSSKSELFLMGDSKNKLFAGWGNDLVFGGDGSDVLYTQSGNDTVFGEEGRDFISSGWGNDLVYGGTGNDRLYAGFGNDQLLGEEGNDRLYGTAGSNTLDGGSGNDIIVGGWHADTIIGGTGDDRMNGKGGADVFILEDNFGDDVITDFRAYNDTIDLSAVSDITDFDDLVANHITHYGYNDALLTVGDNTVIIDDLVVANLDASTFIF